MGNTPVPETALDPGLFFNPGAGASSIAVQPTKGVNAQSPITLGTVAAMVGPGNQALQVTNIGNVGSNTTLTAAQASGGNETAILLAATAASLTLTMPTAAQLYANLPYAAVGQGYVLTIVNSNGTNAITLAAGSGGTLVGSGTIAAATAGAGAVDFYVQFTSPSTYTITRVASKGA